MDNECEVCGGRIARERWICDDCLKEQGEYEGIEEEETDEDADLICSMCSGTGEGQYDGVKCGACGGSGEGTPSRDDEQDEMHERWLDRRREDD